MAATPGACTTAAVAAAKAVVTIPALCIGPETASAAKEAGFRKVKTARESNLDGLVQLTLSHFKRGR